MKKQPELYKVFLVYRLSHICGFSVRKVMVVDVCIHVTCEPYTAHEVQGKTFFEIFVMVVMTLCMLGLNYSAHFIKDVSLIFNFCAENYARIKTCTSHQLFPKEDSKNLRITEVNNLNIFKNRLKYDLASVLHEH